MLPRPDDPTVAPEEARGLIEAACPALRPVRVAPLGRGWDHDVHLVNDTWVFRFPRNGAAAEALSLERAVLPWLAPKLPLPIPMPEWNAPRFAGHRMIPGQTVCDARLDRKARAFLAPALAGFLRDMHAIDPVGAPVSLPGDPLGRFDVGRRAPVTRERLLSFQQSGLLTAEVVERLLGINESAPSELPNEKPVIVHADAHTRNLLVGNGVLSGVIDWVDLHRGQRANDLMFAFEVLPAEAHDTFRQTYGSIPEHTWRWARWRAVTHTTAALTGSIERKDQAFAEASRTALIEMSSAA